MQWWHRHLSQDFRPANSQSVSWWARGLQLQTQQQYRRHYSVKDLIKEVFAAKATNLVMGQNGGGVFSPHIGLIYSLTTFCVLKLCITVGNAEVCRISHSCLKLITARSETFKYKWERLLDKGLKLQKPARSVPAEDCRACVNMKYYLKILVCWLKRRKQFSKE